MSSSVAVGEDAIAVRLLELARLLSPEGNRVSFVIFCEEQGVRRYLQGFPEIWTRITDSPPREGITPDEEFLSLGRERGVQALELQLRVMDFLREAGIRVLAFQGPSLSLQLFGETTGGPFEEVNLFVSPRDARKATSLLQERGFLAGCTQDANFRQREDFFRYGGADGFYEEEDSRHLLLYWRLFPSWLAPDLLSFEEAWSASVALEHEGQSWRTLGPEHTFLTAAFMAYAYGFSRLHRLLDVALCLERLDISWSEVIRASGYRAAIVERVAEMSVRMLGVDQRGLSLYHYSSLRQIVEEWRALQASEKAPSRLLLEPKYWSCHSSEAVVRVLQTITWPHWSDIQKYSFPGSFRGLYHALALFRFLKSLLERPQVRD